MGRAGAEIVCDRMVSRTKIEDAAVVKVVMALWKFGSCPTDG
jgi:hypothetical protein